MCVVQIGELVSQLSDETKAQNKAIPWRIIKDTRNFYVHAYGAIKTDEPRTLDFSGVRGFFVTNVCIVQRSAA